MEICFLFKLILEIKTFVNFFELYKFLFVIGKFKIKNLSLYLAPEPGAGAIVFLRHRGKI
jgi:hypothetical protein